MDVAVAIGCSTYDDAQIADLEFAADDASSFVKTVRDTCGFKEIVLLRSGTDDTKRRPTRANILRTLMNGARLAQHRRVNRLYIFFSGHGIRSSADGIDYLLPEDTIAQAPEFNAIAFPIFQSHLEAWGARNVVIFYDACRAFIEQAKSAGLTNLNLPSPHAICPEGMVTFTSCKPGQAAYESPNRGAGIFTAAISDGLSAIGKQVTVADLDAYLRYRIPYLSAEAGTPRQDPLSRLEPLGVDRLVLVSDHYARLWRSKMPVKYERRASSTQAALGSTATSRIAAVDFGTSFSAIAILDDAGETHVVPDPTGSRLVPSAISFFEDGSYVVGWQALDRLDEHPEVTFQYVKRRLGTSDHFSLEGSLLTAEVAASLILRSLRQNAEEYLGAKIGGFVASAPANFLIRQVNALVDAFALAEMPLIRIVSEPESATYLTDQLASSQDDITVLVADLGGGTFDVCVAEVGDGVLEILSVAGDNALGGLDYDDAVEAYVRRLLWDRHKVEWQLMTPRQLRGLRREVERVKIDLERHSETALIVPAIEDENGRLRDLGIDIDRAIYREITGKLNTRVAQICSIAVHQARLRSAFDSPGRQLPDVFDLILIAGQGAKIFTVREALAGAIAHKRLDSSLQESAVISGLALQVGVLTGTVRDLLLLPMRQRGLGVAVAGLDRVGRATIAADRSGNMYGYLVMRAQNTIPARRGDVVFIDATGGRVVIDIVEEPFLGSEECEVIGNITVTMPSADALQEAQVTFDVDVTGVVIVQVAVGRDNHVWQVNKRTASSPYASMMEEEREQQARVLRVVEPDAWGSNG